MKIFLRRHSLGIPARLTMLAVVTALPLVAVGSFALLRTVDDQRAQIKNDVKQMVESFLADVDREISAIWAELQVLATSPSLQSGNFLEFDQQMRAALKIRAPSIVLHDTHAQQLLSTNRPFGESLPRATNSEMHDRVVATGKPQISDLIMGAVLKRPILTVGVPVFRDRGGGLRIGYGPRTGDTIRLDARPEALPRLDSGDLGSQGHHRWTQSRSRSLPRPASRTDASPEADRGHRELDPQRHE